MNQQLSIITLGVSDLTASKHFYDTILGWEASENSNENIVFYPLNGLFLSLYPKDKLAEDAQIKNTKNSGFKGFTLAINVESELAVNTLINKLEQQGVTIAKHPQKVFWGGYHAYFSDPDENLWEVAYNPFF